MLPLAAFVDVKNLQSTLCHSRMTEIAEKAGPKGAEIAAAAKVKDVCSKPIDKWASEFANNLNSAGWLANESGRAKAVAYLKAVETRLRSDSRSKQILSQAIRRHGG